MIADVVVGNHILVPIMPPLHDRSGGIFFAAAIIIAVRALAAF